MKKLLIILLFNIISWTANASSLDFQLLPSKAIQPGDVAIQVLPIKSNENAEFFITKKSNLGFQVEGPDQIKLNANEMHYLTFITTVPSRAKAGLLHELEIQFFDAKTNQTTTQILTFTIALNQDVDFFIPDQDLTSYTQSKVIPLRISNNGNSNETYEFEVENFTPSAEVTLNTSSLSIPAGESRIAQVKLRFTHKNSHISFFEVRAKVNGLTKFKKRFKVRFISNGSTQNDDGDHYLDTQMVITNDFISIDGENSNLSSVLYSANGNLSDYVSLSVYVQAQMIDGNDREISDMRFDFDGDNWYVHLGTDVSLSPNQNVIGDSVDGVAAGYDFENGFQVGTMVGVNEETEDVHTAGIVSYDMTPNQRIFLLVDQNQSNGDTAAAAGYDGRFQITEKLSFAPSLIVSDSPEKGTRINYRQTLKYMVRDNFPIIFDSGYVKDELRETLFANLESTYVYKNIVFKVGGRIEHTKENTDVASSNEDDISNNSHELYASMAVPITDKLNGQVQFRYLESDEAREYRPELSLSYSNGKFLAQMRSALVKRENKTENYVQREIDWEPIIEIDLTYRFNKVLLQGRAYYEQFNDLESRVGADISALYYLNNKWLNNVFLKVGTYHDQFDVDELTSYFLQVGSVIYKSETTTFEMQATVEDQDGFDDPEYFVGARLTIQDRLKVPRRVQDLFGGNRTGSIKGKICLDQNNNHVCEVNELPIPGIRMLVEGLAVETDQNGEFNVPRIDPGEITIKLEADILGSKNLATTQMNKMVTVNRNQETTIDFGLFAISSIKVFAFFDRNGDGIYDHDLENELDGVEIELSNQQLTKEIIFSGKNPIGIDQLKNGQYQLKANAPEEAYFPTTPRQLKVQLPTQANNIFMFGFAIKEDQPNDLDLEDSFLVNASNPLILPPTYEAELNFELIPFEEHQLVRVEVYFENDLLVEFETTSFNDNKFSKKIALDSNLPQQLKLKINAIFTDGSSQQKAVTKYLELIKP